MEPEDQQTPPQPLEVVQEEYFNHTLSDGTNILVGKPQGVIRIRLRALLGDMYKDEEYKTMGSAFLGIRKWKDGFPSPLLNPNQFEGMVGRFKDEDDLDDFMEKWQKLTNPELTKIVADTLSEALENGWDEEKTQTTLRERTAPLAKARLDRLRDLPKTPSS